MKVINGKIDGFIGSDKIYIGRANRSYNLKESPLHNPYPITKTVNRNLAIELYRQHLWKSIKRMRDARRIDSIMAELIQVARREKELQLQGNQVELTCWCPENCHGDVIISALEWLKTQDWFTDWIR